MMRVGPVWWSCWGTHLYYAPIQLPCHPTVKLNPYHRRTTPRYRDPVQKNKLKLFLLLFFETITLTQTFLDKWLGVAWAVFSFSPSAFKLERECRWTPQLNWSIPSSSWDSNSYSRKSKSLNTPNCWSVVTESSNLESPDRSCCVDTSSIDDAMLDCLSNSSELWLKIT